MSTFLTETLQFTERKEGLFGSGLGGSPVRDTEKPVLSTLRSRT